MIADELLTVDTAGYEPEPIEPEPEPEPEPQTPSELEKRISVLEERLNQILERIGNSGEVDYARLAAAVNDEAAKRLKE